MKKRINKPVFSNTTYRVITCLPLIFLFSFPMGASATVSLPYSSTFNVADWNGTSPFPDPNGMINQGTPPGSCSSGNCSVINSSGNYSGGAGGKGYRNLICDGHNCSGVRPVIYF